MKIRNGFVSNSSSSSFVVVFNPKYNMKGKKKADEFGDSTFDKIIEMYGQKENIFDSADDLVISWCSRNDVSEEELSGADDGSISRVRLCQDNFPRSWKWAELVHPDGTESRISGIINGMADVDLSNDKTLEKLDDYDVDNGYMVLIHKGEC